MTHGFVLAILAITANFLPQTVAASPPPAATYVPVLMYHYIRVNPDPRDHAGFALSVTPAAFHEQMAYLARNHFQVISLGRAVDAIRGHRVLPPRSVVLTFDDGYSDFLTMAVPELGRRGFTATEFVVPGRVGRPSFMTWTQVRQIDRMGFTIGAHTMNHLTLASLRPAAALWEMAESKRVLEGMLGHPVIEFAYPYGSFTPFLAAQARAMGFESAASTIGGSWHRPSELWWLDRQRVTGYTSLTVFAQLVGGPWPGAAPTQATPSPSLTILNEARRIPRPAGRR